MFSNIWVWDPGSEIRDPEKTYSGSRIQGSKRHRIPDPGSATLGYTNFFFFSGDPESGIFVKKFGF